MANEVAISKLKKAGILKSFGLDHFFASALVKIDLFLFLL
jgi:hypothetical protein